jgi:PAS domain S-box-containing protein
VPVIPPDAIVEHMGIRARTLAGDHLEGERLTCVACDGSPVEVRSWTLFMEPTAGRAPEVVVLLLDVTEEGEAERALQASEHRWRTLVQNISDTVTVVDTDGVILTTTGELKPILGYLPESWVGRALIDILHPDDIDGLWPVADAVRSQPDAEISFETRARHHDGTWADIAVTAVNLLDAEAVAGIVLTSRNITDQKRAERLVSSQAQILELIAREATLEEVLEAIAVMIEDHDDGSQAAVLLVEGDRLRPRPASTGARGPGCAPRSATSRSARSCSRR